MQRVLIVSPKEELHSIIPKVLGENFEIEHCYSLGDVFQRLGKETIDLVLCDYRLGSMTGIDLLKILRISHPSTRFVLILAATERPEVVVKATREGAHNCIGHPFEENVLIQCVQGLLSEEESSIHSENDPSCEPVVAKEIHVETFTERQKRIDEMLDKKHIQVIKKEATEEPEKRSQKSEPLLFSILKTSEPQAHDWLKIEIRQDNLEAAITVQMGEFLESENILKVLRESGIVYGLDEALIGSLTPENYPGGVRRIVVARGKPVIHGTDEKVELNFHPVPGSEIFANESGKVDFKEVYQINCVEERDILGQRIPATPGQDGMDVKGNLLKARPGKSSRIQAGKNCFEDPETGEIKSLSHGHVNLSYGYIIEVMPVYTIPGDVDYHTGNIRYKGTVIIHGNVRSGFKVVAEGDIRVLGLVEAAEVRAAGSISIASGVHGANRAKIIAGQNINLRFCIHSLVHAGQDMLVEHSILNSTVDVGGKLIVSGEKGIVGGKLYAVKGIETRYLGSELGVPTEVIIGENFKTRKKISRCLETRRLNLENLEKIQTLLDNLMNIQKDKVPDDLEDKSKRLRQLVENLRFRDQELSLEHNDLQKKLQLRTDAQILVFSKVYSDVKVQIGSSLTTIFDPIEKVKLREHPRRNKIMTNPLLKKPPKTLPGNR